MPILSCRATASPIVSASSVFARADVSRKEHKRGAAKDCIENDLCVRVMPMRPLLEAAWIDQQAQEFCQARFLFVDANKPREPRLRLDIRIADTSVKELVEGRFSAHAKLRTQARSRARPPDE